MTIHVVKDREESGKKLEWDPSTKCVKKTQILGSLSYEVLCSEILVDSPTNDLEKKDTGKVFYTAYFNESVRPIVFFFNGGPGASSMWLHLGAFGPKRVAGLDVLHKEAELIDHPETLLTIANLVFVDPIGTGFSTCKDKVLPDFCSETADAAYLAQFISRFLNQHKLWGRPLFLCGESYGGYRISLLSHLLICKYDLAVKGLIFIAPFLSGSSGEESEPNVIAEANFICGYILSAWYHKRSLLNQSCTDEFTAYQAAKQFAYREYLPERLENNLYAIDKNFIAKLSLMTGIKEYALRKHGIHIASFCANLFEGEKCYPGRIDSRYTLEHPFTSTPLYLDASLVTLARKIYPLMNAYLFNEMGWESAQRYVGMADFTNIWKFQEPFYSSAFASLRAVLKLNPHMHIYAAAGYYDLAVPLAGVEYDLIQVADTADLKERIHMEAFTAGHMMYVKEDSRSQLVRSVQKFILSDHQ